MPLSQKALEKKTILFKRGKSIEISLKRRLQYKMYIFRCDYIQNGLMQKLKKEKNRNGNNRQRINNTKMEE